MRESKWRGIAPDSGWVVFSFFFRKLADVDGFPDFNEGMYGLRQFLSRLDCNASKMPTYRGEAVSVGCGLISIPDKNIGDFELKPMISVIPAQAGIQEI